MLKTLAMLMVSFGKIGFTALGGGNSMLKLLEYEAVSYRHWLGQEEFVRMVGSTFIFPGLTAVKLSALIGLKVAGLGGAILAVVCLNLPGLILAGIGYHWLNTHDTPGTKKLMIAVQYGSLALLAAASFSIAQNVVALHYSFFIACASFVFFIALAFFQISPFWGFLVFIGVCFFLIR